MRKILTAAIMASLSLSALGPALAADFKPLEPLSNERVLQFKEPAWVIQPARNYRAVLETSKGRITLELYPRVAPKTVNNFVFLALNRYYDGVPFHRVLEGFMAQTGDPTGTGNGGPGYSFFVELDRDYRFDKAGVLGMARTSDYFGNGGQFFITLAPAAHLDGGYTVFGRVLEGQSVVSALTRIDPQAPKAGVKPDVLTKVTILEEQPE
ncbi:peptidylprolyl isomerase [Deinobacterium chartae]|uniref:Peptidyl-prolyl cis-trans isomerase n=1 Tax=Deinobacterium chartae TaxID=521158 RepID=A0A841I1J0_9DEIO|nr:peptidylprolyl isomerase [Deinobacterium chartae]MBB6099557.1 peptidylprolyl isomerase [Deinobacterium chartae]